MCVCVCVSVCVCVCVLSFDGPGKPNRVKITVMETKFHQKGRLVSQMPPKCKPNGYWEGLGSVLGSKMAPKWKPKSLLGGSWGVLEGSWGRLGRVLGASWEPLGLHVGKEGPILCAPHLIWTAKSRPNP